MTHLNQYHPPPPQRTVVTVIYNSEKKYDIRFTFNRPANKYLPVQYVTVCTPLPPEYFGYIRSVKTIITLFVQKENMFFGQAFLTPQWSYNPRV